MHSAYERGPTAAFSIAGFAAAGGGATVMFCNATAYPMTVLHEYAGATADERITTPSRGPVVVQPSAIVAFTRDNVSLRCRMWWDSIEWTNVIGKPTAVARIQNNDGTYGSIDIAGQTNGHAGIRFSDAYQDATLMMHSGSDTQGVFRQDANAWSWCWVNGVLNVGAVPWTKVIDRPSTLSGYGITDAAPINSPAFTGTPSAPTPAASDNTTKLATTAFVQNAVTSAGGRLLSTSSIAPSTKTGSAVFVSTALPGQLPFTETVVTSTSPVNVLNITGKGRLRFLGVGHSTATGIVRLNIVVDGTTRALDAQFSGAASGLTHTSLVVPVVGSTTTSGGASGTYLTCAIPEEGFEFTSSLTVQAYVFSGTGYVGWSYRLYD